MIRSYPLVRRPIPDLQPTTRRRPANLETGVGPDLACFSLFEREALLQPTRKRRSRLISYLIGSIYWWQSVLPGGLSPRRHRVRGQLSTSLLDDWIQKDYGPFASVDGNHLPKRPIAKTPTVTKPADLLSRQMIGAKPTHLASRRWCWWCDQQVVKPMMRRDGEQRLWYDRKRLPPRDAPAKFERTVPKCSKLSWR